MVYHHYLCKNCYKLMLDPPFWDIWCLCLSDSWAGSRHDLVINRSWSPSMCRVWCGFQIGFKGVEAKHQLPHCSAVVWWIRHGCTIFIVSLKMFWSCHETRAVASNLWHLWYINMVFVLKLEHSPSSQQSAPWAVMPALFAPVVTVTGVSVQSCTQMMPMDIANRKHVVIS